MITIQVKDSDGSVVAVQGQPADGSAPAPLPPRQDCTIYEVSGKPARPAGDKSSALFYSDGALTWRQPPATLVSLSAALNSELKVLFGKAPLQAQIAYSNIATPIAAMISAGNLSDAITGLQGMLTDKLVPTAYSAMLNPAISLIQSQEPAFADLSNPLTVKSSRRREKSKKKASAKKKPVKPKKKKP